MTTVDISRLATIVLPTATGKTHIIRSLNLPYTQEADEICMPRATERLDELRTLAKRTGNWAAYDRELATELRTRMKPETRIILVASIDLAIALNAQILMIGYLPRRLWDKNVQRRNERIEKYLPSYLDAMARGGVEHATYDDLRAAVVEKVFGYNAWFDKTIKSLALAIHDEGLLG
jgi:hypothetical protein